MTVPMCGVGFKPTMPVACKVVVLGLTPILVSLYDSFFHPHAKQQKRYTMSNESTFSDTIILITREGMGSADVTLQHKLLDTYLKLLMENQSLPAAICFYTEGVKLVVEGSPFLEHLSQIEQKGVRLIICSTCLNYFGISEKVRVGIVGGMSDILEAQSRASKVITL